MTVEAQTFIEVMCTCPYCGAIEDVFDDVRDCFDDGPRAIGCNVEVKCSECTGMFIVTNVNY